MNEPDQNCDVAELLCMAARRSGIACSRSGPPRRVAMIDAEALERAAIEIANLRKRVADETSAHRDWRMEAVRCRKERDEARRRICADAIKHGSVFRRVGNRTVECTTEREVAEMMGWGCYVEG